MQQESVIALLGGRHAPAEPLVGVGFDIDSGAPGFHGERRIGYDIVVGTQVRAVVEFWIGQRVAREDVGGGKVVQDHVHTGETGGGHVHFLTFERDFLACLGGHLEQERTGTAGRVVGGGGGLCVRGRDANDRGDDSANFGGGVELAFALAALGSEVPHEVFVSVRQACRRRYLIPAMVPAAIVIKAQVEGSGTAAVETFMRNGLSEPNDVHVTKLPVMIACVSSPAPGDGGADVQEPQ